MVKNKINGKDFWNNVTLTIPGENGVRNKPVKSYAEASDLYRDYVLLEEYEGRGGSRGTPDGRLSHLGVPFASISYNARIWELVPGSRDYGKELYDPHTRPNYLEQYRAAEKRMLQAWKDKYK